MASEGNSTHLPLQQEGSEQKGCLASPWSCRGGWASRRTSKQTARKRSPAQGGALELVPPGSACSVQGSLPPGVRLLTQPSLEGLQPWESPGGLMATAACLIQTWVPASQARTPKSFAPSLAGHSCLASPAPLLQAGEPLLSLRTGEEERVCPEGCLPLRYCSPSFSPPPTCMYVCVRVSVRMSVCVRETDWLIHLFQQSGAPAWGPIKCWEEQLNGSPPEGGCFLLCPSRKACPGRTSC